MTQPPPIRQIFISHSATDRAAADAIRALLQMANSVNRALRRTSLQAADADTVQRRLVRTPPLSRPASATRQPSHQQWFTCLAKVH